MGDSLREAMEKLDIPIGGENGKALTREIKNFAAAEIGLGVWDTNGNVQHKRALIAPHMSFWLEKNPQQRTIWQPEMTVSREYFDAVTMPDRMAPFYWPAMIALADDVRAMDIHCFLTYRLRDGLARPLTLHKKVLHPLFGSDIHELKKFWQSFKNSLAAALQWYPNARVEVGDDRIILYDSPPLIPHRKMPRLR